MLFLKHGVSQEVTGRLSTDERRKVKDVREVVEAIYRTESRQVLATLIRLLGDFETAEEALHEAFAVAVEQWARDGVPANPKAWLVSTGRFKAIDGIRRRARHDASLEELAKQIETGTGNPDELDDEHVEDDRLRLIFTCCHPAYSTGSASGNDSARALRAHNRGNRARLLDETGHHCAAQCAGESKDPGCPYSL